MHSAQPTRGQRAGTQAHWPSVAEGPAGSAASEAALINTILTSPAATEDKVEERL